MIGAWPLACSLPGATVLASAAGRGGTSLTHMLDHAFMRHAFVAGTAIALAAGLIGYVLALRNQIFTGDALSHVAFTGSLAALAAGFDVRFGLFAATISAGAIMALLGRRGHADDAAIGSVFAWTLGLGVLFLSLYTSSQRSAAGSAGVSVLFGSMFGLDAAQVRFAVIVALVIVATLAAIARPLLFASIDAPVAAARGVPVTVLGIVFLAMVGATAAEAAQAVGALMLLALLAGPGGAARLLTGRPFLGMLLSSALAVAATWTGLTLAYAIPRLPPSVAIVGACAAVFASALVVSSLRS